MQLPISGSLLFPNMNIFGFPPDEFQEQSPIPAMLLSPAYSSRIPTKESHGHVTRKSVFQMHVLHGLNISNKNVKNIALF
ncbi:MAG: hypothetical protein ONB44_11385 [candidate division KSB1 bacterium]|nr:hypothetical protein [candidate division KSB1 bacterium]